MKTKIVICTLVLMFSAFAGSVFGGTEDTYSTAYGLGTGSTTYQYNTYFGNNAGASSTATHNTFIGYEAGYNNGTGTTNTFIGNYTGFSNNGDGNTFLGHAAGTSNSNGNCNTFLGYQTGASNTTGSGNVFLGYAAGQAEAGSNKLYIANSNTSTPLIYGEFDNSIVGINGKLGIGTQAPVRGVHLAGPNAVFRMDRTADTAAFQMVRTDISGNPQKVYVVGTNYSPSTGLGEFVINDNGTALSGPGTRRMTIANDGSVTFTGSVGGNFTGNFTGQGTGTFIGVFIGLSSLTLKDNVRTYENALDTVNRLRGVSFDWKDSGEPSVGLIAEEVAEVIPEVVAYKDGAAAGVNYASLVGVLVEAVKEHKKITEQQQGLIQEQQEAIKELQKRLIVLEGK